MIFVKEKSQDLTEGKIFPQMVKFAVPIVLTFILQQLYNTADAVIVGRFVGAEALAAVGSTGPIISFIICLFMGLSGGGGVVISQLIGAKDKENIEKAVHTSMALSLIGGVGLCIFGLLFADKMINLMNTPKEIINLSKAYLCIYLLGMIPSLIYNFASGIIRASGNSKVPLKILSVSGLVNVIFNIIFVVAFKMGVVGVAVATVISQIVSAALVVRVLMKTDEDIKLYISKIRIHKNVFKRIASIGIPSSITGSATSFSNAVIQATINSFGTAAIAGAAACTQLEVYCHNIAGALPIALLTFIGQNYGAGKIKRCREGLKNVLTAQVFVGLFIALTVAPLAKYLIGLFVTDAEAVKNGTMMIRIVAVSIAVWGVLKAISECLLGYGDPVYPMIVNVFGITGIRLLWIYLILPLKRSIFMLYISLPVSWIISMMVLAFRYIYMRKKISKKFMEENNT